SFFDVFVELDSASFHGVVTGQCVLRESPSHRPTVGARSLYDANMMQLDLSSSLPAGIMVRESPSLPSRGQTTGATGSSGGFMISSFFDIFTEISLDGGNKWTPADQPLRVVMGAEPPPITAPGPNLPPPGQYVSDQGTTVTYPVPNQPHPVIIRNI